MQMSGPFACGTIPSVQVVSTLVSIVAPPLSVKVGSVAAASQAVGTKIGTSVAQCGAGSSKHAPAHSSDAPIVPSSRQVTTFPAMHAVTFGEHALQPASPHPCSHVVTSKLFPSVLQTIAEPSRHTRNA